MAVVEVSIVPVGTQSPSLSEYVAGCITILESAEGVTYQLNPMGTVIEGDLNRVLEIIQKMHEHPFTRGVERVVTTVRIDDRRDKSLTMAGKVAAVKARLRQGQ
ncbi:MAG: hypothetical protein A4E52_02274 [Pelotomaculum sp. PtaB.Bin013]|nr:MAG: hypothetical protein A4E52_02274 [Pelotomaculum sp. PtaB.Bin013]